MLQISGKWTPMSCSHSAWPSPSNSTWQCTASGSQSIVRRLGIGIVCSCPVYSWGLAFCADWCQRVSVLAEPYNLLDRFCKRRGAREPNWIVHVAPITCNPASCRPVLAQLYFPVHRLQLSFDVGQLVQAAAIAYAERDGFYSEQAVRSCATSLAASLSKFVGGFAKLAAVIRAGDADEIHRQALKRRNAKPITALATLSTVGWAL